MKSAGKAKPYTHRHADGTLWAKGYLLNGKMQKNGHGIEKMEPRCARGVSIWVSESVLGQQLIKMEE